MSEHKIPIPSMLYNAAVGGHVTNSQQIIDENENKEQSQINAEVKEALGTGGSVDERIAEEGAKHYLKEETYNKNELNNMITTPNQEYVSVTATAETTAVTDVLPAIGVADTTYRIGNWDGTQYNDSVFSEYAWNGSKYIKLSTKSHVGEVYDISANNADTKYADLAAALGTNGANIPKSLQKGGMSIKFVQSSNNKYVQYRLTATSFSIAEADWQNEEINKRFQIHCTDFSVKHGYLPTSSKEVGDKFSCLSSPLVYQATYYDCFFVSAGTKINLYNWGVGSDFTKALIVDKNDNVIEVIKISSGNSTFTVTTTGMLCINTMANDDSSIIEFETIQPFAHLSRLVKEYSNDEKSDIASFKVLTYGNFRLKNKYYDTNGKNVGSSIPITQPNTFNGANTEILKVYAGNIIDIKDWQVQSDYINAVVVDIDGNILQIIQHSSSVDTKENYEITIENDGFLVICASSAGNTKVSGFTTISFNYDPYLFNARKDVETLKTNTSIIPSISEALEDMKLNFQETTISSTTADTISDLWKQGRVVRLEVTDPPSTEVYGMYGPQVSDGYDTLNYSSIISSDGLQLSRDYYAISLYNSNGISKTWHIRNSEYIPNLESDVDDITSELRVIDKDKFTFINKYINTNSIPVGTYIPAISNLEFSDFNGIYTLFIPLSEGNTITIQNVKVASDIQYMLVIDRTTRIVVEKVRLTTNENTTYTATIDSFLLFAIWRDDVIVKSNEDYKVYFRQLIADERVKSLEYSNYFDYSTALKMDKGLLKQQIEAASNGKCTVIYDNNGYPSLMYKIPLVSIGALNSRLGGVDEAHPAFIVNGVQKNYIYVAVFMSAMYNNVPVSWFGLTPSGYGSHLDDIAACAAKGTGWHMETIWERSLISLLSGHYHNNAPRGNTDKGQSSAQGYQYEYVQLAYGSDGEYLPGQVNHSRSWYNGTQPNSWSHDGSPFGIFDIIGGYHERCDLLKVDNGKVYLCADNSFGSDENNWVDTGVYLTNQNDTIVIDNVDAAQHTNTLVSKTWNQLIVNSGYDNISEAIRKKICLALIHPYLSSDTVNSKVYDFNPQGNLWIKDDIVAYPFLGGAAGYNGSSLGMNIISYDQNEDHGNIGHRLCFID